MPEQLWFTEILNRAFHGPVTALLLALGIKPEYPQAPITNTFAMEILVLAFLLVIFLVLRSRLSVESPGGLQHMIEGLNGFIESQSRTVIGHDSEQFTPFLMALGLFILISNLWGLIPGFESPTGDYLVPLGCAVCVFIYYQGQGFRKSGIKYIAHFAGPPMKGMHMAGRIALMILMFPLEIISHLARVLSLTVRLYGNMFAGDMVILVFVSLIPIAIPILFIGLHIGVAFIQAYVFVLLTTVYLAGAAGEAH